MKFDSGELMRLEERLSRGELPAEAQPILLEAVRHVIRCRYTRGATKATTERRRKRRKAKKKKKGHGRHGAGDYPSAERVSVKHPDLKPGGLCPEPGRRGKLYDTKAPSQDVELKAQPPVQATIYECQVLRCASCQKTFTAPLPPQAYGAKYHPSVDAVLSVMRYALGNASQPPGTVAEVGGHPFFRFDPVRAS